jgi:hypothetical protein
VTIAVNQIKQPGRTHASTRQVVRLAAALVAAAPLALGTTAFAATSTEVVKVAATDDAYTSSTRPNLNTGEADKLVTGRLDGDTMVSYLKFRLGSLPSGAKLVKAQIKLTNDAHHLPGTVKLSKVSSTTWSERTLTYRDAPAVGSLVSSVSPNNDASSVTFDVSGVVRGPGTYSFAVTTPASNDFARFLTAESGSNGPALKLTLERTGTTPQDPDPTPTPPAGTDCTVNAKLVPTCGIVWGAEAGAFSSTPSDTAVRAWEQASGRTASIFHTYHRGDQLFPTTSEIAMAREAGKPRLLMLNWKVAYGSTWAAVARGDKDARIDRLAAHIKANYTEKFYMVLHHEPENDVNTSAGSGMTAKDFAAMFRYTVKRLKAQGVSNAVFVVAYMNYEKWNNQPWWWDLYPGDEAVDWIGLDSYVGAEPGSYHYGDLHALVNRTTNKAVFPGFYNWATQQHPNKPLMLAEWGVFDYAADPSQKAVLFAKLHSQLRQLPAIKGMVYFDTAKDQRGFDIRIDSSPQSLTEFRKIAADPIFKVKVG